MRTFGEFPKASAKGSKQAALKFAVKAAKSAPSIKMGSKNEVRA